MIEVVLGKEGTKQDSDEIGTEVLGQNCFHGQQNFDLEMIDTVIIIIHEKFHKQ